VKATLGSSKIAVSGQVRLLDVSPLTAHRYARSSGYPGTASDQKLRADRLFCQQVCTVLFDPIEEVIIDQRLSYGRDLLPCWDIVERAFRHLIPS